jgi:hypothetical protein
MTPPDLLQEASDPATDPERLRQFANSRLHGIKNAAWKNPSLPESTWWSILVNPEAWDNPMASLYLLTESHPDSKATKRYGARTSTIALMSAPERASEEAKSLLDSILLEWWNSTVSPYGMLEYLGNWASFKRFCSERHRKVVDILRLILQKEWRTGMVEERMVLSAMEDFYKGNCNKSLLEDLSREDLLQCYQDAILYTLDLQEDPSYSLRALIQFLANDAAAKGEAYDEAARRYMEAFANLIRREMPTPPLASDQRA